MLRKPLVHIGGTLQELPSADTLEGSTGGVPVGLFQELRNSANITWFTHTWTEDANGDVILDEYHDNSGTPVLMYKVDTVLLSGALVSKTVTRLSDNATTTYTYTAEGGVYS